MHDEFADSPGKVKDWASRLIGRDRALFDAGYLVAVEIFMEEVVQTKNQLLVALLDDDLGDDYQMQLLAKLHLLDVYEHAYRQRAEALSKDKALQTVCASIYA